MIAIFSAVENSFNFSRTASHSGFKIQTYILNSSFFSDTVHCCLHYDWSWIKSTTKISVHLWLVMDYQQASLPPTASALPAKPSRQTTFLHSADVQLLSTSVVIWMLPKTIDLPELRATIRWIMLQIVSWLPPWKIGSQKVVFVPGKKSRWIFATWPDACLRHVNVQLRFIKNINMLKGNKWTFCWYNLIRLSQVI